MNPLLYEKQVCIRCKEEKLKYKFCFYGDKPWPVCVVCVKTRKYRKTPVVVKIKITPESKTCKICKVEKSSKEFYKKTSNRDNLDKTCINCRNVQRREKMELRKKHLKIK